MNRHTEILIYLKPYIKKYMVANYGEKILITEKDIFSNTLYRALLVKKWPFKLYHKRIDQQFTKLTESYPLILQKRKNYAQELHLKNVNFWAINHQLELRIQNEIFLNCEIFHNLKMSGKIPVEDHYKYSKKAIIEDFCKDNNLQLNKDIKLSAILKAEYRYRQQKGQEVKEDIKPFVRAEW